jgi:hypothetical protein
MDKGEHTPSECGPCFEVMESGTNALQADTGESVYGPRTVVAEEESRPEIKTAVRHTAKNETNPEDSLVASMMLSMEKGADSDTGLTAVGDSYISPMT